jgi:hypothetical protein
VDFEGWRKFEEFSDARRNRRLFSVVELLEEKIL